MSNDQSEIAGGLTETKEKEGKKGGTSSDKSPLEQITSKMEDLQLATSPSRDSQWGLDEICSYIKATPNLKILTMVGAGISTAAGIPDFRSKHGIYNLPLVRALKLRNKEELFHIDFFRQNPEPFYRALHEVFPTGVKPTFTHYFIRFLAEKGFLLRHYTQNVDGLEEVAGMKKEDVVYAHGKLFPAQCLECSKNFSELEFTAHMKGEAITPFFCPCGGLVKPGIVFYGESIPDDYYVKTETDVKDCNMVIVMGSSLTVTPFCVLPDLVHPSVPRLLINLQPAGFVKNQKSGLTLQRKTDVALLGECDEGVKKLCKALQWEEELLELVGREHGNA